MRTRLIHITPELPPTVGGVGDYTAILSHRLVEVSDGALEPVLVHAGKEKAEWIDVEFPVVDLSGQCSAALLANTIGRLADEAKGRSAVLLEYSGYGYAKRGAPLWLARGLHRACGDGGVPLVTMFHELYASGPPWTSAFWMSGPQRWVSVSLALLSDALVTNRKSSREWLEKVARSRSEVQMQPVFSNVGEPEAVPAFADRLPQASVFGGGNLTRRHAGIVDEKLHALGVENIVDLGPSLPRDFRAELSLPIEEKGILPEKEISAILTRSRFGVVHAPSDCITKSGVAAAYLSHGVIPLLAEDVGFRELREDIHYISSTERKNREAYAKMSEEGQSWYNRQAHSHRAALVFQSMIEEVTHASALC